MAQLMTCSIFSLIGTAEDPQTEQPLLKQPPSLEDSKETEEIETSKKRQSFEPSLSTWQLLQILNFLM